MREAEASVETVVKMLIHDELQAERQESACRVRQPKSVHLGRQTGCPTGS